MIKISSAKESEFDELALKIARATDDFEAYRNPHAERLSEIADRIAQKLNIASEDRRSLRQAALIHDLGAAVMNRKYVKKQQSLNADERMDMQRHTIIGEQEAAKRGFNRAAQLLVRWHHEWWNGAGYPDALEREQIPLTAAILRIADTYVSMIDTRPYRAAASEKDAKEYLSQAAGIEFDPKIVKAFLAMERIEFLSSSGEPAIAKKQPAEPFVSEPFSSFDPS